MDTEKHANWYQTTLEPFMGWSTILDGEADLEVELTDLLLPGRRHISIVDKVHKQHRLREFVEQEMPDR